MSTGSNSRHKGFLDGRCSCGGSEIYHPNANTLLVLPTSPIRHIAIDHKVNSLCQILPDHTLRANYFHFGIQHLPNGIHGLVPQYLADDLSCVSDIPGRRRLRSASSFQLEVPRTRLVTVGDRTFSAAGSRLWNSLPRDVTECQTLAAFR